MKRRNLGMDKKRLDRWVSWSLDHLEDRRVDPFLQGWRCAYAVILAFDEIPPELRTKICAAVSYAESTLWKKTRKIKMRS